MNPVANRNRKEIYIKCKKCGTEIYFNTHKKMTACKCGAVGVDGCEDYVRVIGNIEDHEKIQRTRDLGDWHTKTLSRMRALILKADPGMIEERKWRKPSNAMAGVPVWSHNGIICTGETYTKVVKLTFARGASLPDPSRLFNSSLEGSTRRAIDIHEGETVDAAAFKALVKAAVARNSQNNSPAKKRTAL